MILPALLLFLQAPACSVEVEVLHSLTQAGLPLSEVRFRTERRETYLLRTKGDGVAHAELIPGRYRVTVTRRGFAEATSDKPVECRAGTKTEVRLQLVPHALVRGRVVDEDGEPVTRATVMLFRRGFNMGHRQLMGDQSAETNDEGEFQIRGIVAGRYYVRVDPRPAGNGRVEIDLDRQTEPRVDTGVFYPGSLEVAQATLLRLAPAQEMDLGALRVPRVRVFRVRGHFSMPGGAPSMDIDLYPVAAASLGSRSARFSEGDRFEIENVSAGDYRMVVRSQGMATSSLLSVTRDIDNLTVAAPVPVTIAGVVRVEGAPAPDWSQLMLNGDGARGAARLANGGRFELALPPGSRRLWLGNVTPRDEAGRLYVAALRSNGVELPGDALDVSAPVSGVEVVLRADKGTVEFQQGDKPLHPVLVPAGPRWDRARVGESRVQVPPGEYLVFALESAEDLGAWENEAWLRDNLDKMRRVTVRPGATLTLEPPRLTGDTQN
jgi:hypothetical protein